MVHYPGERRKVPRGVPGVSANYAARLGSAMAALSRRGYSPPDRWPSPGTRIFLPRRVPLLSSRPSGRAEAPHRSAHGDDFPLLAKSVPLRCPGSHMASGTPCSARTWRAFPGLVGGMCLRRGTIQPSPPLGGAFCRLRSRAPVGGDRCGQALLASGPGGPLPVQQPPGAAPGSSAQVLCERGWGLCH